MRLRIFWPGHLGRAHDIKEQRRARLLVGWWRSEGREAHIIVAGAIDQPEASGIEELRATLAILNETLAARDQDRGVARLSPELQILGVLTRDQKGKQKDDGKLDVLELLREISLVVALPASCKGNRKGSKCLSFMQIETPLKKTIASTSVIFYDCPVRQYLRFLTLDPLRLSTASLTQQFRAQRANATIRSSRRPLIDKLLELKALEERDSSANQYEAAVLRATVELLNQATPSMDLLSSMRRARTQQAPLLQRGTFALWANLAWAALSQVGDVATRPLRASRKLLLWEPARRNSLTVKQVELRLSQVLYWPFFAAEIRHLRKNNLASVSNLAADYITLWGGVWLIANDIVLGQAFGDLLQQNIPAIAEFLQRAMDQHLRHDVESVLQWLSAWPFGLKLNSQLSFFFGDVFSGLSALFYEAILLHLQRNIEVILKIISIGTQYLGLTMGICLVADLATLATMHLTVFHAVSRFLYNSCTQLLGALFHLFRGKKRNPLRNGRIDDASYEFDQMLLGTILFTLLLFLFPTIFTYHLTCALARFAVVAAQAILSTMLALLNHIPLFALMLRIKDPERLPAGVQLQLAPKVDVKVVISDNSRSDQTLATEEVVAYNLENVPLSVIAIFDGYSAHLNDLRRLPSLAARVVTGAQIHL